MVDTLHLGCSAFGVRVRVPLVLLGRMLKLVDKRVLNTLALRACGFDSHFSYNMKDEKFNLFGSEWTIKYVDVIPRDDDGFCFGITDYITRTINVATIGRNGEKLPKSELRLTKAHELMHAILGTGCYTVTNDEPLVEWLGRCICSLRDQKIIT